jgi:hypothetical protein
MIVARLMIALLKAMREKTRAAAMPGYILARHYAAVFKRNDGVRPTHLRECLFPQSSGCVRSTNALLEHARLDDATWRLQLKKAYGQVSSG